MFTKIIALLVFSAVLIGVLAGLNWQAYPTLEDDLVFQRVDGAKQTFQELKGRPLLITFWSPGCIICMHEVNDFNRLYLDKNGGQDFELLALSMYYDRPDWVLESKRKSGMTYPVYFDLHKNLSKAFGNVVATPTSFLVDQKGEIVYRQSGKLDFDKIEQKLIQLIG